MNNQMKKRLVLIFMAALMVITFLGCNKQLFDATYSFDKAIISLPNGKVIEGNVDSWTDYEDGDQIQVKINDTTYLVHSSNIVLIEEK